MANQVMAQSAVGRIGLVKVTAASAAAGTSGPANTPDQAAAS
jgi:hypothetical protein